MQDLNKVILVGRLTKDLGADERSFGYLQNGTCKAVVSIAVNNSKKSSDGQWVDEASFFDVVIWGKTAENLKPYLTQGQQIAVEGRLKQDRWKDKQTGNNMSRVIINAESVQLVGSTKRDNSQGGFENRYSQPQSQYAQQYQNQQMQNVQPQEMYGSSFPEDIPF